MKPDTVEKARILAQELADHVERLECLPPREAAAGLRKTLVQRCLLLRSLMATHYRAKSFPKLMKTLQKEQRTLALTRVFRETGSFRRTLH
jgi:hypothetical protein